MCVCVCMCVCVSTNTEQIHQSKSTSSLQSRATPLNGHADPAPSGSARIDVQLTRRSRSAPRQQNVENPQTTDIFALDIPGSTINHESGNKQTYTQTPLKQTTIGKIPDQFSRAHNKNELSFPPNCVQRHILFL